MSTDDPAQGNGERPFRYLLVEMFKPTDEWLLFPVEKRKELFEIINKGVGGFEAEGAVREVILNTPEGDLREDWRVVIVFKFPTKDLLDRFRTGAIDLDRGLVADVGRDFLKKIHVRRVWGEIQEDKEAGTKWMESVV